MDNLIANRDPSDIKKFEKKIEVKKVKKKYTGPNYNLGDIISYKNNKGIVFKQISDEKFWVAFPELQDRMDTMPCLMDVLDREDFVLFKN